jgi:predicted DNA-binding transcriptional regulator YafY
MLETTARLLGVLSTLQRGAGASGPQLADRLGVTVRTVRRDVDRLRQLGYAIESDPGVAGGYRLGRGGSAVPPLMLDEEEAVALAVAVRSAAGDSVVGVGAAAERALAKLEQSLPSTPRSRIAAVTDSTVRLASRGDEVDPAVLLTVSAACREQQQLRVTYCDAAGRESERRLEPHRVVSAGRRWYLVAHDLGVREWRTFRLDRVVSVRRTGHGVRLVDPPDAASFVHAAITTAPYHYRARIRLDAPVEQIAARVPATVAVLEAVDESTTMMTTGADELDILVVHLGVLGVPFVVHEPDELRERVAAVAEHLARASRPVS